MYKNQENLLKYILSLEPIFANKGKIATTALEARDLYSDIGNNYVAIKVIPETIGVQYLPCNRIEIDNNNELWLKFEGKVDELAVVARMTEHITKKLGSITSINTDAGALFAAQSNTDLRKNISIIRINFTMKNEVDARCVDCIELQC